MTSTALTHKRQLRKLLLVLVCSMALLLAIASYVFRFISDQYASQFVDSYLAKSALNLGFERPLDPAGSDLVQRIQHPDWSSFELTAKDLNLLLTQKLKLQERFYVTEIKNDTLRIIISWPLLNGDPDSYLAGQAVLRVVFTAGLLRLELVDFLYEGQPVPRELRENIPFETLLAHILEDFDGRAIIDSVRSLDSIKIAHDKLLLERSGPISLSDNRFLLN